MLLNVVRLCVQDAATLEPERRRNRWVFFVTQERKIDDRHCGSRFHAVPEDFDDFAITCPRSGGRVVVPQLTRCFSLRRPAASRTVSDVVIKGVTERW